MKYLFLILSLIVCGCQTKKSEVKKPNVILIFVDDMGYGDLGCYGSTKNKTPNLDQMAKEGTRYTEFYVAAPVCTPSRAALMTGSYAIRVDMHVSTFTYSVLFPKAKKGLNPSEYTIPKMMKNNGYATACIGKWHLGDQYGVLPTDHGFDYYYGIPYSNDMGSRRNNKTRPPLPMMRGYKVIEAPVDQTTVTKRYTEETIKYIEKNKDKPFFIYLPHTMPHLPLFASKDFKGKSANGRYGDTIEELDWSTGEIIKALKRMGLDKNTMESALLKPIVIALTPNFLIAIRK